MGRSRRHRDRRRIFVGSHALIEQRLDREAALPGHPGGPLFYEGANRAADGPAETKAFPISNNGAESLGRGKAIGFVIMRLICCIWTRVYRKPHSS